MVTGMNYCVLIVEDDLITLELLRALIQEQGFSVYVASTIEKARQIAQQQAPDILLSDMSLPDGSATELMQELNTNSSIYGILVSGYDSDDTLGEIGFYAQLTKPIDFNELEKELVLAKQWVENKRVI